MPQVQNTRSVVVKYGQHQFGNYWIGAVPRPITSFAGSERSEILTQTVNSFRSGDWRTDAGESTAYEGLTGEQLKSEVNLETQNRRSRFDTGHEFWSLKTERTHFTSIDAMWTEEGGASDRVWFYSGFALPSVLVSDLYPSTTGIPALSQNAANVLGTKAVAATRPGKSPVNLLVSLAELYKDGLPSYTSARSSYHQNMYDKSASQAHLETQMAVKPMAADIKKLAEIAARTTDILNQYERDSGRNVRRRLTLDATRSTSSGVLTNRSLSLGSTTNPSFTPQNRCIATGYTSNHVDWTEVLTTRTWFSGAFTYHLDQLNYEAARVLDRATWLLGAQLTPEVIWELTRWSWLFDWFANFGSIISNISATFQNSLVLRYGYLMRESTIVRHTNTQRVLLDRDGRSLGRVPFISTATRKERFRASPYGFGVDLSGLSAQQWSILGALGMTKSPRSLFS